MNMHRFIRSLSVLQAGSETVIRTEHELIHNVRSDSETQGG
jgi:hypothetical protein